MYRIFFLLFSEKGISKFLLKHIVYTILFLHTCIIQRTIFNWRSGIIKKIVLYNLFEI